MLRPLLAFSMLFTFAWAGCFTPSESGESPPPAGGDPATLLWPHTGSRVVYDVEAGETAPDGSFVRESMLVVTFTYDDGWTGWCAGRVVERTSAGETEDVVGVPVAGGPPMVEGPYVLGERRTVQGLSGCEPTSSTAEVTDTNDGAWVGQAPADERERPPALHHVWDAATGLVVQYDVRGSTSHRVMTLRETDAPLQSHSTTS